ncbi:MAG: BA14K family protein [Hyphomicrobiaceae bacterium]
MLSLSKSVLCAALCATTLISTATLASAAPVTVLVGRLELARQGDGLIDQVQYRRPSDGRRYNRYSGNRYRSNSGRNLALGIGGLIVGGIVLSETARSQHRQDHSSDWRRCAQTYRSFEPDTGMYTGYDGERHTCPYLR